MEHLTDEQLKQLSTIVGDDYNIFVSTFDGGVTAIKNFANTNDDGIDTFIAALHTEEDLCDNASEIVEVTQKISEALTSIALQCFQDESVEYITIHSDVGKVCGKDDKDLTTPELEPLIEKCCVEYYMQDKEKADVFDYIVSGWYSTISSCLIRCAVQEIFDKNLQKHYPECSVTGVIYGYVIEKQ